MQISQSASGSSAWATRRAPSAFGCVVFCERFKLIYFLSAPCRHGTCALGGISSTGAHQHASRQGSPSILARPAMAAVACSAVSSQQTTSKPLWNRATVLSNTGPRRHRCTSWPDHLLLAMLLPCVHARATACESRSFEPLFLPTMTTLSLPTVPISCKYLQQPVDPSSFHVRHFDELADSCHAWRCHHPGHCKRGAHYTKAVECKLFNMYRMCRPRRPIAQSWHAHSSLVFSPTIRA